MAGTGRGGAIEHPAALVTEPPCPAPTHRAGLRVVRPKGGPTCARPRARAPRRGHRLTSGAGGGARLPPPGQQLPRPCLPLPPHTHRPTRRRRAAPSRGRPPARVPVSRHQEPVNQRMNEPRGKSRLGPALRCPSRWLPSEGLGSLRDDKQTGQGLCTFACRPSTQYPENSPGLTQTPTVKCESTALGNPVLAPNCSFRNQTPRSSLHVKACSSGSPVSVLPY